MKKFLQWCLGILPLFAWSQSSYTIATGEKDRERLVILNELYNASSQNLLEIEPGHRILTLGCGIALLETELAKAVGPTGSILATDMSVDQLKIAKQNASANGITNLKFMQLDVEDVGTLSGPFDRIHCRLVLTHLPFEKVKKILPKLYELLAPNGMLVIEEIASLDSLISEPPHPSYDRWKTLCDKQYADLDLRPGERIADYLKEQGYSFTWLSFQPILKTEREKKILSLGVRSIEEKLLKKGAVNQAEIEEAMTLLEDLEKNPMVFPRYFELKQIILRK